MNRSILCCLLGLLLAVGLWTGTVGAQEMTVELDPAKTRIEFTMAATLHTVHGSFLLKNGTIHFNPSTGSASGLVVVDARSGNSGNKGRDRKMHREIIESERYPQITLTPTKLSGKFERQGDSTVELEGKFKLHGSEHSITLAIPIQMKGNEVSGRTHFAVPYVEWGLKNPSTMFLHVSDTVVIDIAAAGQILP
jgi:polyisoprenoid-binding protein YceI